MARNRFLKFLTREFASLEERIIAQFDEALQDPLVTEEAPVTLKTLARRRSAGNAEEKRPHNKSLLRRCGSTNDVGIDSNGPEDAVFMKSSLARRASTESKNSVRIARIAENDDDEPDSDSPPKSDPSKSPPVPSEDCSPKAWSPVVPIGDKGSNQEGRRSFAASSSFHSDMPGQVPEARRDTIVSQRKGRRSTYFNVNNNNKSSVLAGAGDFFFSVHDAFAEILEEEGGLDGEPPKIRISVHSSNTQGGLGAMSDSQSSSGISSAGGQSENGGCNIVMMTPNSRCRTVWDGFALALICYDFISIPLSLLRRSSVDSVGTLIITWISFLFWTLDLPLAFLTGYMRNSGGVELRIAHVAKRYLSTWFVVDFILVFCIWLELLGKIAGIKYNMWAIRVTRFARLIRVAQIVARMNTWMSLVLNRASESMTILFSIVKVMLLIWCFMHMCACMFFHLAMNSDDPINWVDENNLMAGSLLLRYLAAFYWSLSLFAGECNFFPHSVSEYSFVVCATFAAFMISLTAVSIITTSMTQLHLLTAQSSRQIWQLQRFLTQHGVPSWLSERILRNANHVIRKQRTNMAEENIELLQEISLPLRMELRYEVHAHVICSHQFFECYTNRNPTCMHLICFHSVKDKLLTRGDLLFSPGEHPEVPVMYFVRSGELSYTVLGNSHESFTRGQWANEAPLWTDWVHQGLMRANCDCDLMSINAQSFRNIAVRFKAGASLPAQYATEFVRELNKLASSLQPISELDSAFSEELEAKGVNSSKIAARVFPELADHADDVAEDPPTLQANSIEDDARMAVNAVKARMEQRPSVCSNISSVSGATVTSYYTSERKSLISGLHASLQETPLARSQSAVTRMASSNSTQSSTRRKSFSSANTSRRTSIAAACEALNSLGVPSEESLDVRVARIPSETSMRSG